MVPISGVHGKKSACHERHVEIHGAGKQVIEWIPIVSFPGKWHNHFNIVQRIYVSEVVSIDRRRVYLEAWRHCKQFEVLGSCVTHPKQPSELQGKAPDREGMYLKHSEWLLIKMVNITHTHTHAHCVFCVIVKWSRLRIMQAVSIFIDMDESGGRANEWIYK